MSEKISWETVMVYNSLKNLVYTGTLVSRKRKACGVGSKKRVVNEPVSYTHLMRRLRPRTK